MGLTRIAMSLFSIAVPTFRRPVLLQRALESLINQTEQRWEAFVFDDSPAKEGEHVVKTIADERVHYHHNAQQLGAAANVDACFGMRLSKRPGWGCVLEDDNFFLPEFLEHVAHVMNSQQPQLALFNQRIHRSDGKLAPESDTTRGDWYSEGWIDPLNLHASLLLMEGLSNGGVVWRTDMNIRLEVGPSVRFTTLHEACRSLLIRTPFWFSKKALAVWSELPLQQTARHQERNRIVSRGTQSIMRFVLATYGWPAVVRAAAFARDHGRKEKLISRLIYAGAITAAFRLDSTLAYRALPLLVKGAAVRAFVGDPCAQFLNTIASEQKQVQRPTAPACA